MSILIKGMEMPKNCFECPWRCKVDPDNLLCRISGEYFEETFSGTIQSRHKSCPLVPVPTRHGRLIDADALSAKLNMMLTMAFSEGNTAFHFAYRSLGKVVENAPTIIPAEPADAHKEEHNGE